jgi:phospholipid/cholesterol/gamma-HCH transport system substrate-binding protein
MRANRSFEIGTGLFVLLGFAALLFLTTQLPNSGLKLNLAQAGYAVTAQFDNVGDLKSGSPVTLDGVRVGEVEDIHIDWHNYRALVTMRIDPQFTQIPDDSDASIATQGLLGGKYIAIGPGGSETYLKNGSQIQFTQSAIVLENLVNKLFANFAGGRGNDSGSGGGGSEGSKGQASGAGKPGEGADAAGSGGGTGHAADRAPGNATPHRPAPSNGH